MPGLHECPTCHYRFETAEDLDAHLEDGGCPEAESSRQNVVLAFVRRIGQPVEPPYQGRHRAG